MFQFPGLPYCTYGFSTACIDITLCGFSHSDIHESAPACGSSWLFAAYRVLLRLLVPRHPPYALIRLTSVPAVFLQPDLLLSLNELCESIHLSFDAFLHPYYIHISSLVKKLSVQFARLEIVLPFTEKLFHYTLCSFQRTFLSLLLTRSSLKIKQLKLSRSLSQTFDVFAAIAAP